MTGRGYGRRDGWTEDVHFLLGAELLANARPTMKHLLLAFFVLFVLEQCGFYPNLGLSFGYWKYPNRAIASFKECSNVISAKIEWINRDLDLEEFKIALSYTDDTQTVQSMSVQFPQYPTQEYIDHRVAEFGCQK